MNQLLLLGLIVSAIISLVLVVRVWRASEYLIVKYVLTLITFVPFIGPVFYWFYWGMSEIKPQAESLQNRGARGTYTDTWNSIAPIIKRNRKEKAELEAEVGKQKDQKHE